MALPDISLLSIHDPGPAQDRYLLKYREYVRSIPYGQGIEPESKMLEMLDFIVLRLTQCCAARDYEVRSSFLCVTVSSTLTRVLKGGVPPMGLHADLLANVEISHTKGGGTLLWRDSALLTTSAGDPH